MNFVPAALQNELVFNGGVWLLGGAIRSVFDKTQVSDFDLFFKDEESKDKLEKRLLSDGYKIVFKCKEGKLTTYKCGPIKIQAITEVYRQSMEEHLATFDINASKFGLDCNSNELNIVYFDKALRDAKKKKLTLDRVMYPVATFNRLLKYKQKGYTIDQETIRDFCVGFLYELVPGIFVDNDVSGNLWRAYID